MGSTCGAAASGGAPGGTGVDRGLLRPPDPRGIGGEGMRVEAGYSAACLTCRSTRNLKRRRSGPRTRTRRTAAHRSLCDRTAPIQAARTDPKVDVACGHRAGAADGPYRQVAAATLRCQETLVSVAIVVPPEDPLNGSRASPGPARPRYGSGDWKLALIERENRGWRDLAVDLGLEAIPDCHPRDGRGIQTFEPSLPDHSGSPPSRG